MIYIQVVKHSAVLCAYAVAHPALLRADLRFLVEDGDGGGLLTLEGKHAWLACEKERLMRLGLFCPCSRSHLTLLCVSVGKNSQKYSTLL